MIDLNAFRCSQAEYDFDSSPIVKEQSPKQREDDLLEDLSTEEGEEAPQPERPPRYVSTNEVQLEHQEDIPTQTQNIGYRPNHVYDYIIDRRNDAVNNAPQRNQAWKTGKQPGLLNNYGKWVFVLLIGVALVSLIVGTASGTISTLLLNRKEDISPPVSIWTSWSDCSKSCGTGIRRRSRECPEVTENSRCSVPTEEYDLCMKTACQNGVWTTWSLWSPCDVTCDVGVQTRTRDCQTYNETVLGSTCLGLSVEAKVCYKAACRHGVWTTWSLWSPCDVTCDVGVQTRTRDCQTYNETLLGSTCLGLSVQAKVCYMAACRRGGWSAWEAWGSCDRSCDGGVRIHARQCTNPAPSVLGNPCNGAATEAMTCNMQACSSGNWYSWGSWTVCSVGCGGGIRIRNRSCSANSLHGTTCVGDSSQVSSCNNGRC